MMILRNPPRAGTVTTVAVRRNDINLFAFETARFAWESCGISTALFLLPAIRPGKDAHYIITRHPSGVSPEEFQRECMRSVDLMGARMFVLDERIFRHTSRKGTLERRSNTDKIADAIRWTAAELGAEIIILSRLCRTKPQLSGDGHQFSMRSDRIAIATRTKPPYSGNVALPFHPAENPTTGRITRSLPVTHARKRIHHLD